MNSWCFCKALHAFSQKHFVHVHTRVTAWACESLRASVSLCCSLCMYSSECAPSFSLSLQLMSGGPPLQQAWQLLATRLELAVFLMVIIHFVPRWIILHRLCLGPRGEPHKVNLASQRITKSRKQKQHPTPGPALLNTQQNTQAHTKLHACTSTLISYSQFQQAYTVTKRAACAKVPTHSSINMHAQAAPDHILMICNHFVQWVSRKIANQLWSLYPHLWCSKPDHSEQ